METTQDLSNKNVMDKIDNIEKTVGEIQTSIKGFHVKFDEFVDKQEKKFASIRVEAAMKIFIGTLCLGVIGALLKLVII